jgi:excisionase family DNA binding protein
LKTRKKLQAQPALIESRLLSTRQAAAYLNCHVWFIRNLAWKGTVPHLTLGHRLLFDRADLDKFIEKQKAA